MSSHVPADWDNFYTIAGSAGGALTGLVFVVITIVSGQGRRSPEATATFTTPTVVHFGATLLFSFVLAAPWHGLLFPASLIFLAALWGLIYIAITTWRMSRLEAYKPDLEDVTWHTVLPLAAYAAALAGAIALPFAPERAMYGVAFAVVMLMFVGIHNAWDIVIFITLDRDDDDDDANERQRNDDAKKSNG